MKVLHLSTYDDSGGAARGAYWLHTALAEEGVESRMLVARKSGNDDTVFGPVEGPALLATKVRGRLDNLPLAFYEVDNFTMFSPAWVPTQVHRAVNRINPDIVHLHWICNGFMSPRDIAGIGLPIVWTMRDMWAFTGGCHYAKECDNYIRECGSCPHLNSGKENDLSRRVWRNKKQAWERKEFHPVAISQWLANCAQKSSLFGQYQTCTVPNALDETTFHPVDKLKARRALGLPEKGRIILFGSINATTYPRKGFDHVSTAVRIMVEQGWSEETTLVIFGAKNPQQRIHMGMPHRIFGHFDDDEKLRLVYSAGDVMLVPSIQEAFGKTAIEAMACGTPVVCFDTSGLKDIVDHRENGYRARCFDPNDLATGIQWVLHDGAQRARLAEKCREKVLREFTLKRHAQRYKEIYGEILKQ